MCGRHKDRDVYRHFKQKLLGRYGISLTDNLYREWVSDCRSGAAPLIQKQTHSVAIRMVVHGVGYDAVKIPVVYNKRTKWLVSALPQEALKPEADIRNMCVEDGIGMEV